MKLKPIVASMALLVTGSAFAAYHPAPEPAKVERLQSKLDRNFNEYYAESDWYKRIMISGLAQVNFVGETNTAVATNGGGAGAFTNPERSATDIYLSRANFYMDVDVNDWTEVHLAFDFGNNGTGANHTYASYDERAYVGSNAGGGALPDEATITIGNFAKSQFYFRGGREYVRYGNYERNVTPATFTQLLTQTQADALEVGFVDISGFNGALYVFRATPATNDTETHINDFGLQLGYVWQNGDVTADFTADWMYDIFAVNYMRNAGARHGLGRGVSGNRVGGFSFTAKVNYNQFDFIGQYASSDSNFPGAGFANTLTFNGNRAFPIAWMLGAGYTFGIMNNDDSRVGLNFQMTHEALGLSLPCYRIQGDFSMEIWKNTEVGLTLLYDRDYDTTDAATAGTGPVTNTAGTGNGNFTGLLSLTAKFA